MPDVRKPTRLRDSPGLSLRPSRNLMTRLAWTTPGQRRIRSRPSSTSTRESPRRSAASPLTTACSKLSDRAKSATVRGSVVTDIPSMTATSLASRDAACSWMADRALPPGISARVSCTRVNVVANNGSPWSTAADVWLTTAPGASSGIVARTRRRCCSIGSSGSVWAGP